ncbi:MAG TPA: hypothetical protein VF125_10545 [Solirubrobacterales bacterium]
MSAPGEGAPSSGEASAVQLFAKALAEAASPGPHAPRGDLFEGLDELEQNVLLRHWENGSPNGNGSSYFDEAIDIRLTRLRKKARNETWGENIWLAGKVGTVLLALAAAWQYIL